jgi:molybdenum cofactor cytidylyltransferase
MGNIGAVVLAAGGSTRLGRPKQLLEINGETLVHSAVRAALEAGCDAVSLVTGANREAVERTVNDLHPLIVHNDDWHCGIGSSIRCGVQQIRDCAAVVLLACDQPALDADIVRALIDTHKESGRQIVASRYANTLGIPALFGRECFAELLCLPDDRGAKHILEADPKRIAHIEFPGGELDLDTPADFAVWRERCSVGAPE